MVDIYDIDGFLTTKGQINTAPSGLFPAAALGRIYYGYPEERWVDFRQLDALKPMLTERISMCARKGFDAVELDHIDSFSPPSTTGFYLTPGDAQCYLYYECGSWHVFTMDKTAAQPTGKWVGEAEYGADHYVCDPGQRCQHGKSFAAFCRRVYSGRAGFAAVKFDVNLDGRVFFPCPRGR